MEFSNREEFELHVHKCFGKIFENLTKVDAVVKEEADRLEEQGEYGVMSDLRDWVEDTILHCHLAWQYHRLSRPSQSANTWDVVNNAKKEAADGDDKSSDDEK